MLKTALYFGKSWKNCLSVGGAVSKPPLSSDGWGLWPPEMLFPFNLHVIF